MDTVIFDLDGTLACGKHRLHLLPRPEDSHRTESWDDFNLACANDAPITDNIVLCRDLYHAYEVIILTGRCDVSMEQTKGWLAEHSVPHDRLIMRPASDNRRDIEFKDQALREIGLDRIRCCFDDLEHVARHIRSLGVTCYLVTHYDEPTLDVMPAGERK